MSRALLGLCLLAGACVDAPGTSPDVAAPADDAPEATPDATPATSAATCAATRVDAHPRAHTCDAISAPSAAGTWRVASSFPDAPADIRDHFCAYTWRPTTAACAPAPIADLALDRGAEHDAYHVRQDCPGAAGCDVGTGAAIATPPRSSRTGGGCTACGAVKLGVVYVVLPSDATHGLSFNVNQGKDTYGFDVAAPTSRVFSVALPPLASGAYDDGPITIY
jgi:hypothetical protein